MSGYFDRLASRARLEGSFATLEEPRAIVWIVIIWTWGSALNTAAIASVFFGFAEPEAGWASTALAAVFAACWFVFALSGRVRAAFAVAIAAAIAVDTYIHLTMGGYANSGGFFFWGVGVTVVSTLALPRAWAIAVGSYWVGAAWLFGVIEEGLRAGRAAPEPGLPAVMFPYTVTAMTVLLVPAMAYLLTRLASERERAEGLLLNVLPPSIAMRLKAAPGPIADDISECTVLFADIVGFTARTRQTSAAELVEQLNEVFSRFDRLAERHGAQKIKTIGDGYMVVAGVPDPVADHLEVGCGLALDMLASSPEGMNLRIGMSTGPVVAGIIGTSRFSYDLWGNTVNMASRMESHGEPGRIQVTREVRQGAGAGFTFEPGGTVDLKGIGPTEVFFLTGRA